MANQPFLFINKSASSGSLSHSEIAAEKSTINKHVQAGRRHGKRTVGISTADAGPPSASGLKPKYPFHFRKPKQPYDDDASTTNSRSEHEQHREDAGTDTSSSGSSEGGSLRRNLYRESKKTGYNSSRLTKPPLEDEDLGQNGLLAVQRLPRADFLERLPDPIDPFNVFAVKLDPTICGLFQYYIDAFQRPARWHVNQDSSPRTSLIDPKSGDTRIQPNLVMQKRLDAMFRAALGDEMSMYCILVLAGSLRVSQEGTPLRQFVLHYIQKAIAATKQKFTTSPHIDEKFILSIFNLCGAEWMMDRPEAAMVHLRLVKALVDQIGGLSMLSEQFRENMLVGDGFFAAERNTLPMFSYYEFEPGSSDEAEEWLAKYLPHPSITQDVDRNPTCTALLAHAGTRTIPPLLHSILIDLRLTVSLLGLPASTPPLPPHLAHWMHVRNLTIRHRLLSLPTPDRRTAILRLTLVIWMIMSVFRTVRRMVGSSLAPRLQNHLELMTDDLWGQDQDIHCWCLVVGAKNSRYSKNKDCEVWFVEQLRRWLKKYMGEQSMGSAPPVRLDDVDGVGRFLKHFCVRFFHVPVLQGENLWKVAEEVVEAERRRGSGSE